jgi:hypothetical protein
MALLCQRCILAPQFIEVLPQATQLVLVVQQLIILAPDDLITALQPAGSRVDASSMKAVPTLLVTMLAASRAGSCRLLCSLPTLSSLTG